MELTALKQHSVFNRNILRKAGRGTMLGPFNPRNHRAILDTFIYALYYPILTVMFNYQTKELTRLTGLHYPYFTLNVHPDV